MFPPNLEVIECDNPNPAPLEKADHLKLVPEPKPPADADSAPRPLRLRLINRAITLITGLRFRLELTREHIERECAEHNDPDRQIGGRGW